MAAPSTTIWELAPHTRAKHEILRRYLAAWTPVMTHGGFEELLYIDGFAGPGEYVGGHDGSPIIALRTVLDAASRTGKHPKHVFLYFVEKEHRRAEHLKQRIEQVAPSSSRPEWCRVKVVEGAFADAFAELLVLFSSRKRDLPPTFAFIDPFGWNVPFQAVREVMKRPNCEVFVNFMYEEVNRFLVHPPQAGNFDEFFGTSAWRELLALPNRVRALHDLYATQLRDDAGAKYVRSFQMRNEHDVTDYYLFHGTKSLKGLKVMKEAMWHADERGEFTFSDATDPNQLVLLGGETHDAVLRRLLAEQFRGKEVTVGAVEQFVVEATAFRETHYKGVLRQMELSNPTEVEAVNPPLKRRRGTFGQPSMKLRFR